MPSFDDFPIIGGSGGGDLSKQSTIRYPEDDRMYPAVVTMFDDQQSIEVQSTGSGPFWGTLPVTLVCPEADADKVVAFLDAHQGTGIPFYFTHRKRGRILVRWWPWGSSAPTSGTPPTLQYVRTIAGNPDLVTLSLMFRQEGGS